MCRPVPRQSRFTVVWYFLCNRNRSRNLEQGYDSGSSWVKIIRFRRFRFRLRFRNTDTMIIKLLIFGTYTKSIGPKIVSYTQNIPFVVLSVIQFRLKCWYCLPMLFCLILLSMKVFSCFISRCCYECGILDLIETFQKLSSSAHVYSMSVIKFR